MGGLKDIPGPRPPWRRAPELWAKPEVMPFVQQGIPLILLAVLAAAVRLVRPLGRYARPLLCLVACTLVAIILWTASAQGSGHMCHTAAHPRFGERKKEQVAKARISAVDTRQHKTSEKTRFISII